MRKYIHIVFISVFLAIIAAMPLLTLLSPPRDVSPYEFRTLQDRPEFSVEKLWSGAYFAAWEDYYKDHIFARDAFIRAHVYLEMNVLRRRVINEVFISGDQVLPIIPFEPPIDNITEKTREAAARYARVAELVESYGGAFLLVGLPSQTTAFLELYPSGIFNNAQNQLAVNTAFFAALDELGVAYADMGAVFADNEPFYYLSTDHHLTLRGGLVMADAIKNELERTYGMWLNVPTADDLIITTLPNDVLGSRGRRLYGLSPIRDSLDVFAHREHVPFRRIDNGVEVKSEVVHLPKTPQEFTSYSVYMGGDISETVISTDRPWFPSALIYGDSHTNILEALLYQSFDEQRSIDLRHYTKMGILEYIKTHKPDVVVLVIDDRSYLRTDGNGAVR
jgi:hypothetical protein